MKPQARQEGLDNILSSGKEEEFLDGIQQRALDPDSDLGFYLSSLFRGRPDLQNIWNYNNIYGRFPDNFFF
jgi:hypothetical protein